MLILRVRQCEVAVGDGRLDEAYSLVQAYAIANHRRGQRVIARLVEKLIERGNAHLKAERFAEAITDGDKAAKLGGNQPGVVALRTAAIEGISARQRDDRAAARVVAEARRQLDHGQLSIGEGLLDGFGADATAVVGLKHEIEKKRAAATAFVKAGQRALECEDWHAAVQRIADARAADPNDSAVISLSSEIIDKLQEQVAEALGAGQLDRAAELVNRLLRVDSGMQTRELASALDQVRDVWRCVKHADFGEARILMTRVAAMGVMTKATWVNKVVEQLTRAEEAIAEIRTGPLGWVERGVVSDLDRTSPPPTPARPSPQLFPAQREREDRLHHPQTLPANLMIAVDGVGSFLVVRTDVVRVGAVSATMPCDVAFVAEPTLPTVTIERVEDDYFLRTRAGERKLLASGEKLELSPRCRMLFRLPTRASTSAVLDLTGARLTRSDVRRVVLMDQDVVIGPGATSHIGVEQASGSIVLYVRNEQLFVRNGGGASEPVTLGAPLNIGNVSFVVTGSNERR